MGVGFGAILPIRRSPAYRPVSADTGGSQSRDEPRGSTQTVIRIEAPTRGPQCLGLDCSTPEWSRFCRCRTVLEKRCCYPYARRPWNVGACGRKNGMARKLNVASSDPPLGPPVPGWLPRQLPPLAVMSGRFCRVEPIDSIRHGEALYAAYATDREGRLWDVPSVGTVFRGRRIVRTDRCRPGQRRTPGIRTDRSRERCAVRPGELSKY